MASNLTNIVLVQTIFNYFNRMIYRYEDPSDYYTGSANSYFTTVNFNPGDGIETELVLGIDSSTNPFNFEATYLITYESVNSVPYVRQRWWVMKQTRTRAGQYRLKLRRDVIADNYDKVIAAPCFIEKATIKDPTNPLLYNKENMQFNQIKKSETFLKDETGMAWIVGYIDRSFSSPSWTQNINTNVDYTQTTFPHLPDANDPNATVPDVMNIGIPMNLTFSLNYHNKTDHTIVGNYLQFPDTNFASYIKTYQNFDMPMYLPSPYKSTGLIDGDYIKLVGDEIVNDHSALVSALDTYFNDMWDEHSQNYMYLANATDGMNIRNANGKILHDTRNNKYYKIEVSFWHDLAVDNNYPLSHTFKKNDAVGYALATALGKPVNANMCSMSSEYDNNQASIILDYVFKYTLIKFIEIDTGATTINIPDARNHLNDAPYDMFAIPYPLEPIKVLTSYTNASNYIAFDLNKESSLLIAQSIAAKLGGTGGSSFIYDLQILPYCPFSTPGKVYKIGLNDEYHLSTIDLTSGTDYTLAITGGTNVNIIYFATQSNKTFDIYNPIIVENPKIENETKFYRLVSPNYSGMFEFSAALNGGVNYFNVDITFKPYNPYIHVNPNFNFLYGQDFNDVRGLVCGGDYSVAIVDDKWANFEINNKNYQLIFDREVKNLQFTRSQERIGEAMDLISGTAAAAVQGGMMGGAAGAIGAGIASAAGGAMDIAMNEERYKEQLSLKTDLFGYNLGNIKALPNSLTKSMSLNGNFKFWPFLEEYDCTDREKELLVEKLKYDGMTVMAIDTISNYIYPDEKNFIKGQMIRFMNIEKAADVAYEIYNEIKRGVYI